jgi:hypothetical protein
MLNKRVLVAGECCRRRDFRHSTREKPFIYKCIVGLERVMGIEPTWLVLLVKLKNVAIICQF